MFRTKSVWLIVLLMGLAVFSSSQISSAVSQRIFTSTADFDGGTKIEAGSNYFEENGIDQPSNWIAYPNAAHGGGRTFIAWQGAENYSMFVKYYDVTTTSWSETKRVVNGATENPVTGDGHGSPSLLIDASGYLHLFCCAHDTAIQHYKSNNIYDVSAWTEKAELTGTLTYPHPVLVGTTIYVIYRSGGLNTGPWGYRASTDGGETFGSTTNFLDFSPLGTAYIGGTELQGDRIYMNFVFHDATGGARKNAYAMWLNTTSGNVFCFPSISLGSSLNKAEADTNCLVDDTVAEVKQSNFGPIHVDSLSNGYVLYKVGTAGTDGAPSSTDWETRFSRWNGVAWTAPDSLIATGHFQNYADFILNSATNIEAFLVASSTLFSGEGGDVQRWTWNGTSWTLAETVSRTGSTGKPLSAPVVPRNHHNRIQVTFPQRHFDNDPGGPANAFIYAWGDRGFVFNPAFPFGPRGIQTSTDINQIPSGEFQLSSARNDTFSIVDTDANTFLWGNNTIPRYGTSSTAINWTQSQRRIDGSVLNMTLRTTSSGVVLGSASTSQLSGDFNISIVTRFTGPSPSFDAGFTFAITNEQCIEVETNVCSLTVDGVAYWWGGGGLGLRAFNVTNGVETLVGSADFPSNPNEIAISKVGTTITWYYRNTPGTGTWLTDETNTFTTDALLFPAIGIWNSGNTAFTTSFEFDNYNVLSGTVIEPGWRPQGEWSTPVQTWNDEVVKTIVVNFTGVSSVRYIDQVVVVNNATGEILFVDDTDRISGISATSTIPDADLTRLHGFNWFVRVRIVGDGAGSPSVNTITINTVRSTLTIAIADMPWIIVFVALLTLGMIGAFAIRKRRQR